MGSGRGLHMRVQRASAGARERAVTSRAAAICAMNALRARGTDELRRSGIACPAIIERRHGAAGWKARSKMTIALEDAVERGEAVEVWPGVFAKPDVAAELRGIVNKNRGE